MAHDDGRLVYSFASEFDLHCLAAWILANSSPMQTKVLDVVLNSDHKRAGLQQFIKKCEETDSGAEHQNAERLKIAYERLIRIEER